MAKCCICGKEMSSFSLNCVPLTTKVNGKRQVECRDCYNKYKGKVLQFIADGKAIVMEDKDTEIRKKCNVCGHLYCYSLYDLERNKEKAAAGTVTKKEERHYFVPSLFFYTVCVKKTSPPKSASRSRASWARPSSSNRPKAVGPVPLMLAPNAPH